MSARVAIRRRSIRWLRFDGSMSRWLFTAAVVAGLLSFIRYAAFPPRPELPPPPQIQRIDQGAQVYAETYARAYLTVDARDPELHQRLLAPFVDPNGDPDGGYSPPEDLTQDVEWASVVQARPSEFGGETYTVAAQTTASGLVYITVTVRREADGSLQTVGLPAIVGAPAARAAQTQSTDTMEEVVEPSVSDVVTRALRNYLARDTADLRADLSANAVVSLPPAPLTLQRVQRVVWGATRTSVLATVDATDEQGGLFELTYEMDVDRSGARPYISAIQTNPRS